MCVRERAVRARGRGRGRVRWRVTGAGKGVRPVLFSPVGQLFGIVDVFVWDGERVVVIREEEAGLTQILKS